MFLVSVSTVIRLTVVSALRRRLHNFLATNLISIRLPFSDFNFFKTFFRSLAEADLYFDSNTLLLLIYCFNAAQIHLLAGM
jgi:hypothetical protein